MLWGREVSGLKARRRPVAWPARAPGRGQCSARYVPAEMCARRRPCHQRPPLPSPGAGPWRWLSSGRWEVSGAHIPQPPRHPGSARRLPSHAGLRGAAERACENTGVIGVPPVVGAPACVPNEPCRGRTQRVAGSGRSQQEAERGGEPAQAPRGAAPGPGVMAEAAPAALSTGTGHLRGHQPWGSTCWLRRHRPEGGVLQWWPACSPGFKPTACFRSDCLAGGGWGGARGLLGVTSVLTPGHLGPPPPAPHGRGKESVWPAVCVSHLGKVTLGTLGTWRTGDWGGGALCASQGSLW